MSNQKPNFEELSEKLPELINYANDKLTVILGNAEIALHDMAGEEFEFLKRQLQVIATLSEEIGIINGKIMGLISLEHGIPEDEEKEKI